MPDQTAAITFIVPGEEASASRGARSAGVTADLPRGRLKQSVRVGVQRGGGQEVRVTAVPGEDVVVLHIAGGPALMLHPENARDLMLAQSGDSKASRGTRTSDATLDVVRVPAELQWRGLEHAIPARGAKRGFLGDVVLSAVEVITGIAQETAADFAASEVVKRVDAQVDAGVYALSPDVLPRLKGTTTALRAVPAAQGEAILVLVHGTFSETSGTFHKLWVEHPQRVRALFSHYRDRVYGLEHPTLGVSPIENALTLLEALPHGARLHLVTHSRGGLVAEVLARACAKPALAADDFAFFEREGYEDQLTALKRLARLAAEREIRVERVVRIACPSRGTLLASKRLDAYVSVFKWTLELAGIPVAPVLVDFLGVVAQRRADPELIPGLAAQIPGSPLVQWLHSVEDAVPGELRVIAGDIEGDSISAWLKTLLADAFYWTDNDLVVQTRSMYGGAPRSAGATFLYDQGGAVTHFNYFANERTAEAIENALTRADAQGFRAIGPLSWAGESASGVRAALTGAGDETPAREKPCVFILPGILGSNLKVDGKRVWLHRRFINGLKHLDYVPGTAHRIEPDGALEGVYDELERFLADTHEVIEFAFDWRRPLEEEAQRLAVAVEAALNARADSGQPVRMIAHSMGGLVARTMQLERPDVWAQMMSHAGARLLMLGTPNGGSWAPMQVLSGDDNFGNLLVAFGALFQDAAARALMARLPGFMQLQAALIDAQHGLDRTETWQKLADQDLAQVREYNWWHNDPQQLVPYQWGVPPQDVLDCAVALRKRLDAQGQDLGAFRDKLALVVGHAPATPDGYEFANEGLVYLDTAEGDGRVTLSSAGLPGVRAWRVDAKHGDLPGKKEAFEAYLELLRQGTTQNQALVPLSEGVTRSSSAAPAVHVRSRPSRTRVADRPPETRRDVLASVHQRSLVTRDSARTPLTVTLTNGDLTFVRLPLMLGHYQSMRLTGSEKVMDGLIGGTMSESLSMGHYPGAPGDHQVFVNTSVSPENPWQLPRPEAVIVVGLGEEGKLRPVNLQHTVFRGVLAWAQRITERAPNLPRAFDLAATLIGSGGIGITVAECAQAIVRGVLEANEALTERRWPCVNQLDLIDLYLDRASEAWRAVQIETAAKPGQYTVADTIRRGAGALKRPLESGYRGAPYDFVRAVSESDQLGENQISYALNTRRARSEVRAQATQGRLLRELLLSACTDQNDDAQIGRTLFRLLVPLELRAYLSGTSEIQLELDRITASIPWELLDTSTGLRGVDETRPWAIRTKLLRKLQTVHFRAAVKDATADASVLVIGEPDADPALYARLSGARTEARAVMKRLTAPDALGTDRVKALISGEDPRQSGPDARTVINALLERDWRIVHIAGHGEPPLDGDPRGVVLSSGAFLGPREIHSMEVVPELVFVNCCHLAAFTHEPRLGAKASAQFDRPAFAAGVAEELINIGVRCVVAAGWAVDDDAAELFATTFYDALLKGRRFIDAIAQAREAAWTLGDNTWAAYQCYGDPEWTFVREAADAQKPARPLRDEFASVASADALVLALETLAIQNRFHKPQLDRARGNIDANERAKAQREETRRLEGERAKIRHLEARFTGEWGRLGFVAEAFGKAWDAAADRSRAVEWYEDAVAAQDGSASLRATEQLANLRVRIAWARVEKAQRSAERRRIANEARAQIAESVKRLETLAQLQSTMERESLLGSAYKRLAMVEAAAGGDDTAAIRKMQEHYARAEAHGRAAGLPDVFYPGLNSIVAELALTAGAARRKKLDTDAVAAVRHDIARKARDDPDFWSVAGLTELDMWQALDRGDLASCREEIERQCDDLHDRVSARAFWSSVYDTACFVLPRYAARAGGEEQAAANALLARLKVFATGSR